MLRLTNENDELVLAGRHVEADHQQDTGDHGDDERRACTALEHRDAHGQK
jgi:hypothetical protein